MSSAYGFQDVHKASQDAFFAIVDWTNSAVADTQAAIIHAGNTTGQFIVGGLKKTVTVLSTNFGYSNLLRVFAYATQTFDVLFSTHISSKKFDSLVARFHLGQSAFRVIPSLNYFVSGKAFNDIREGKLWDVVSGVGFAAGGAVVAALWLKESGIYPALAGSMGSLRVFGVPFLDIAFGTGLAAAIVPKVEAFMRGEDVWYNGIEIVSLSAEVALCALSALSFANHALLLTLSLIAVGTATCGMFMKA